VSRSLALLVAGASPVLLFAGALGAGGGSEAVGLRGFLAEPLVAFPERDLG
jgi:hypothetical protein